MIMQHDRGFCEILLFWLELRLIVSGKFVEEDVGKDLEDISVIYTSGNIKVFVWIDITVIHVHVNILFGICS